VSTTDNAAEQLPVDAVNGNPGEQAAPAPPKLSKMQQQKQKIFRDRMQRLTSKGMTPQQAYVALQKEDYERLPVTEKMKRLEATMIGAIQQLGHELQMLQQNDQIIADAMDANFRAITKILTKLGVSAEEQGKLLAESENEIKADRQAKFDARKAEMEKQHEEAKKAEIVKEAPKSGEPEPAPEDATTFGG
jgi:hypothetical protein